MFCQSRILLDKGAVNTGTPFRAYCRISGYSTVSVQWCKHNATGSGTVNVYASLAEEEELVQDDLDPASNPYWAPIPSPFASQPTTAIDSEIGPIADAPGFWLLVEVVAAVNMDALSIIVEGKGD